jgi:hypothetical protein
MHAEAMVREYLEKSGESPYTCIAVFVRTDFGDKIVLLKYGDRHWVGGVASTTHAMNLAERLHRKQQVGGPIPTLGSTLFLGT